MNRSGTEKLSTSTFIPLSCEQNADCFEVLSVFTCLTVRSTHCDRPCVVTLLVSHVHELRPLSGASEAYWTWTDLGIQWYHFQPLWWSVNWDLHFWNSSEWGTSYRITTVTCYDTAQQIKIKISAIEDSLSRKEVSMTILQCSQNPAGMA